jgi:hypothetical protein
MADSLFFSDFSFIMIKKIFINIAIVIAVVFVLDFVIGTTLQYFYFKETSGLHFRTTYSMDTTQADILVFGSSRANHHYVPEVFEDSLKMSFYNTGRDGNGIFYQTALLSAILRRHTPKLILLENYGDFEKNDNSYDRLSSLLPYYKTHEEIRNIIELKSPFEKIKLISKLYPFNSQILTIVIGNLEINKQRRYDNKGYVALNNEWQSEIDSINNYTIPELDSIKLKSFRRFIELAKNSGTKVFVISSPIFLKFNRKNDIDLCKAICSIEKIPFWDFSRDTLFLNNKHLFHDVRHLNNTGAIIFSSLVVRKIEHYMNGNEPSMQ